MNDRKFSLKAEHVLRCAQAAAGELGHGYVGCEHLLLAMLREEDDAACRALNASGIYESAVRERMIEKLGRGTAERSTVQGLTPHARCAVELAVGEALRAGSGEIEAGHLLLGILRDSGNMAIAGCGYQKAVQRYAARDEPVAAQASAARGACKPRGGEKRQDALGILARSDGDGTRGAARPRDRAGKGDRPRAAHPDAADEK